MHTFNFFFFFFLKSIGIRDSLAYVTQPRCHCQFQWSDHMTDLFNQSFATLMILIYHFAPLSLPAVLFRSITSSQILPLFGVKSIKLSFSSLLLTVLIVNMEAIDANEYLIQYLGSRIVEFFHIFSLIFCSVIFMKNMNQL
jgi:hypothetical protein